MEQTALRSVEDIHREGERLADSIPDIQVPDDAPPKVKVQVAEALQYMFNSSSNLDAKPRLWMKLAALGHLVRHDSSLLDAYLPPALREPVIRALASDATVRGLISQIRRQTMGHARSKRVFVGYDHRRYVADLEALLDLLRRLGVDTKADSLDLAEQSALFLLARSHGRYPNDESWKEAEAAMSKLFRDRSR